MLIRAATSDDAAAILSTIMPVIRDGTTYAFDLGMSPSAAIIFG